MNPPDTMEQTIREKLNKAFAPLVLDVENDSHRHAGHAASPNTGESHFRVNIVADRFAGLSRVERHRLVNEALARELSGQIHALAIQAKAPGE
jgi:BolA protein